MDPQVAITARHRASYILERGVWSARCRICGYTVKEPKRSAAATSFLVHIRAMRLEIRLDEPSRGGDQIDLTALASR